MSLGRMVSFFRGLCQAIQIRCKRRKRKLIQVSAVRHSVRIREQRPLSRCRTWFLLYLIVFDASPTWSMAPPGDGFVSDSQQRDVELANHAVWAAQVSCCAVNETGLLSVQIFTQTQSFICRCSPELSIEPDWVHRDDIQSLGAGLLYPVIPQPYQNACCLVLQPAGISCFALLPGCLEALQFGLCDPNLEPVDPCSGDRVRVHRGYWYRNGVVTNGALLSITMKTGNPVL